MTHAVETKIIAPVTASIICPGMVCMSVSYQDWFRKYNSGIFPTANTTIVINSFLGSNTRYSSSAFTMRMSDSFATIGVSVVFSDLSYRQDFKAFEVFLHRSKDVLTSQVCRCNNGQCGFQFR